MRFEPAAAGDAAALAALHTAVADHLTGRYGRGPWSSRSTEKGVLFGIRHSRIFLAREETEIVATLRLSTRKPWAIDTSYFTACRQAFYLTIMAVAPSRQHQGNRQAVSELASLALIRKSMFQVPRYPAE